MRTYPRVSISFLKPQSSIVSYTVVTHDGSFEERTDDAAPFRVLSLGAGVESTTLLLMAATGELETGLDAAIFADTGAEMDHTYETLDWLIPEAEARGVDVHVVTAGDWEPLDKENAGIWTETLDLARSDDATRGDHQPFFVDEPGGGGYSMTRRKCTRHYKIRPVSRKISELRDGRHVERWQGVSLNEMDRINAPDVQYTTHRFPLLAEKRMSRSDCRAWLHRHGYPEVKKSACKQCPFRKKQGFAAMRTEYPDTFDEVAEWEEKIREHGGLPGMDGTPYMIKDLQPLRNVPPLEGGQGELFEKAMDLGGCSAGACGL